MELTELLRTYPSVRLFDKEVLGVPSVVYKVTDIDELIKVSKIRVLELSPDVVEWKTYNEIYTDDYQYVLKVVTDDDRINWKYYLIQTPRRIMDYDESLERIFRSDRLGYPGLNSVKSKSIEVTLSYKALTNEMQKFSSFSIDHAGVTIEKSGTNVTLKVDKGFLDLDECMKYLRSLEWKEVTSVPCQGIIHKVTTKFDHDLVMYALRNTCSKVYQNADYIVFSRRTEYVVISTSTNPSCQFLYIFPLASRGNTTKADDVLIALLSPRTDPKDLPAVVRTDIVGTVLIQVRLRTPFNLEYDSDEYANTLNLSDRISLCFCGTNTELIIK